MRFFKLSIVLAGIIAFAFGCAGTASNLNTAVDKAPANTNTVKPAPEATVDELASARAVYKENCAGCHMANGEGGTPIFDGKQIKVPSFKKPSALKAENVDFIDQITDGSDEMPAFKKKLSAEQIKDQVKFIRKEFQAKTDIGNALN